MLRNSFIFLNGVGTGLEERIWKQGITCWEDFRERSSVKGIGSERKNRFDNLLVKAEKNYEYGNRAFFKHQFPSRQYWRLFRDFSDSVAYVDIETTGLDFRRNDITTVGFFDGSSTEVLVRGKTLNRGRLQELFDKYSLLVTFNGKRFDLPFIKAKFPDIKVEHPHIDLMYDCKKIGLSGGLKSIEKDLGINREGDGKDVDGLEAVRLWKRYKRNGDNNALETLVEYNKKDVRNLEPLMEHVYGSLKSRCFGKCVGDQSV